MNLKKLTSGRWQVRWREDGVQRAKNHRSKERAQDFLRRLARGESTDRVQGAMTFATFAEKWHRDYCRVEKVESQWVTDRSALRAHLIPEFGRLLLPNIRKTHLLDYRARLKTEGKLAVKTINLITALARKMLHTAVDWELLTKNPWTEVKLLKQPEQAFAYWSRDERDRFLTFARRRDGGFADLVEFACHTGLRLGEIRGLKRDCLDFDRGVITVKRGWARDLDDGSDKLLPYTKGKRIREIEMNDAVKRICLKFKLLEPVAFVFEFAPSGVSRSLRRVAKAAGVKEIRFHDLRHTFASQLTMAGVPLHKIQRLLGHTDMKQTLRYAHLSPESLEGLTTVLVSAPNGHQSSALKDKSLIRK